MTEEPFVVEPEPNHPVWIVRVDVVRRSLRRLIGRSTHAFYPGYLHLRQQAAQAGDLSHVRPRWPLLGHLLEVPEAPPKKPHLKPFHMTPNRADQFYWWNSNIAGSYAPSSLRVGQGPLEVVAVNADGTYSLPEDHAERALRHLLRDVPLSAADVAVFLFRDYGLVSQEEPTRADLIDVFRREFGLADDEEFGILYRIDDEDDIAFEPASVRGGSSHG